MNKIYKVVWSKAKHCYVVTSELAKQNTKGCGARNLRMAAVSLGVAAALIGSVGFATPVAEAAGASDNTYTATTDKAGSVYGGIAGGSDPGADYRGGWSSNDADEASRNTVTINGGAVTGDVYGGTTTSGDASYNAVTIDSGTVSSNTYGKGNVYGGNSYYGNASYNAVTVNGGTVTGNTYSNGNVYGGNTSSGEATHNTVIITGGTISRVYGGNSNLNATNNTVTVQGGTVGSVTGAYSSKEANNNTVNVSKGNVGTSAGSYAVVGAANDGTSSGDPVASGNSVTVTGTAQVTGLVIGARDAYYAAVITDNTVTIDGSAVVTGDVFGGYGWHKDKTQNRVYVNSGTVTGNVYGVELNSSYSSDTGNATSNEVHISGGTVSGSVYGGAVKGKVSGNANSNKVEISGGEVKASGTGSGDTVYGGYSETGNANGNKVQVSGESIVKLTVYGGVTEYTEGTASDNEVTVSDSAKLPSGITAGWSRNKDAKNNTVTVEGGTVQGYINGGVATGAADNNHIIVNDGTVGSMQGGSGGSSATGNTVEINGGTVTDTNTIFGGNSNAGTVTENTVTINKGTVNTIYGGYSNSGTVTNNTVTISDGSINGRVYGGSNGTGDTNGNKVLITGGALSSTVYGGYGYNGVVTGNMVTMTAGQVNSFVYGGVSETKAASSNNVKVSGGKVSGGVIGGRSGKDYGDGHPAVEDVKNNTVEISGDAEVTSAVYGGRITNATANVEDNTVTIKDSSKVNRGIHGGQTNYGNAIHNKVTIEGGTITGQSYGDYVTGGRVSSDSNGKAQNNEVEISGGTVSITVQGGFAQGGETTGNKVTISGGTVTATVEGAYNTGDVRNNSVTITGGKLSNLVSGGRGSGSATGNTVAISGGTDSWIIIGGNGMRGATGNTVTISGGDLTVTQDRARPIYGGYTDFYDDSPRDATGNTVNLTGNTTGLETRNIVGGYIYNEGSGDVVSGNELHVGGTKDGSITGTWTGSSNNKVNKVANFETIAYHSVKWDTSVAALDTTAVENVGAIDINDLAFTGAASSGTMAMLKSGSDLSAIKLNYSGGTGIAITTDGVVISGGGTPTTETDGVNGVKLTSTSSDKVLLAADKLAINYTKGVGTVSAITFGEFDIDADNATRNLSGSTFATTNTVDAKDLKFKDTTKALQKNASVTLLNNATGITTTVANGTGKTIGIKGYEDPQKIKYNATATGNVTSEGGAVKYTVGSVTVNSIDLAGWTGTTSDLSLGDTSGWTGAGVAVSGSFTEPEMKANSSTDIVKGAASGFFTEAGIADAIKYKEGAGFTGDEANGVTLAGTQSKGVQIADSGKKLVYAVGAKEVTEVTLGDMAAGAPRTMDAGYDFAGVTTINAGSLQFDKPEEVKADAALVANATGLAAGKTVTGKDHAQNFTKTAENQVVL
ncbi:MAG: ESPR domain-containing protein, partial [Acidaminococcaceae bacterium]|nr:ESPR domain-containing protein [Acidaminococcaceae bacterium]